MDDQLMLKEILSRLDNVAERSKKLDDKLIKLESKGGRVNKYFPDVTSTTNYSELISTRSNIAPFTSSSIEKQSALLSPLTITPSNDKKKFADDDKATIKDSGNKTDTLLSSPLSITQRNTSFIKNETGRVTPDAFIPRSIPNTVPSTTTPRQVTIITPRQTPLQRGLITETEESQSILLRILSAIRSMRSEIQHLSDKQEEMMRQVEALKSRQQVKNQINTYNHI